MPEVPGQIEALERLDHELAAKWEAAQIAAEVLSRRFPNRPYLIRAWRLPKAIEEGASDLIVAVDNQFPWSLPFLALPEATNGISYPHVETDGHLCLAPDVSSYALPVSVVHLEQLVVDANDLLRKGRAGINNDDFYAEAQSYWSLIAPSKEEIWLTAPLPKTHAIWSSIVHRHSFVIAPNKQAIEAWAASSGRQALGVQPALVIRCPNALPPEDYPLALIDLFGFIEKVGAGIELKTAISRWPAQKALPVVLAFEHEDKDILLGGSVIPPGEVYMPGAKRKGVPGFSRGGRAGVAAQLAALSKVPNRFPHLKVVPIYRSYLQTRTAGTASDFLADKHVIVAGCGALGGQLAVQLAQAGVGRLTLLDDEQLDWRNVGRHVLDGSYVGRNKAIAVEEAIRKRFPDADVKGFARSWEAHWHEEGKEFGSADLMISVTGEAASNLYLDALASAGEVPSIIFGWLEPFGVASHAVFRHPNGGGLADITTPYGRLTEPVADLETAPALPQEPSCGAFYQPYSSLSALPGVALIGELALDALLDRAPTSVHRVAVGGPDEFSMNGLSVHPVWHPRLNNLGFHRRFEIILPKLET